MADDATWLAEVRAREQAATPGPWWYDENTDHGSPLIFAGMTGDRDRPIVSMMTGSKEWGSEDYFMVEDGDARLMAHARTDIPRLLALIDAQGKRAAELERENRMLVECLRIINSDLESGALVPAAPASKEATSE